MTGLVLDAINKLLADDSPACIVLTTHPYLVSVLAMLMTLYPMPETPRYAVNRASSSHHYYIIITSSLH